MTISYKSIILVCVIAFSTIALKAQSEYDLLENPKGIPNNITYGRLSNGFTYYIKPLKEKNSIFYINFYIKNGSQDSDQYNVAHALEHMAFESSKNFPNGIHDENKLMNELGVHINGHAGDNSTTYTLQAATTKTNIGKILDFGFMWFRDIAINLKLTQKDINKVRAELRQEFFVRTGGNDLSTELAKNKLHSKLFPCNKDFSKFNENKTSFEDEALRRFYYDWYRPDLMGIAIVGNIDNQDLIEERIRSWFSDIIPHKNPRKRPNCDSIYLNQPKKFVIVERKTSSLNPIIKNSTEFLLSFRDIEIGNPNPIDVAKRKLVWQLLLEVLNWRYKKASMEYLPSFKTYASYGVGNMRHSLSISISSKQNKEKEAFKRSLQILFRLKKGGISTEEWLELKRAGEANQFNTKFKNGNYWLTEIKHHFINGKSFIDPKSKNDYLNKWISLLTREEFNKLIKNYIPKMPEDIGMISPSRHTQYSEKEIRKWVNDIYNGTNENYKCSTTLKELMGRDKVKKLKTKKIVSQNTDQPGVSEFILENGVRIVFKLDSLDLGENRGDIMIHGFKENGASCFSKEDYFSAVNAPKIVMNSGFGGLNKFDIKESLRNTTINFNQIDFVPYINNNETGIKCRATQSDIESLFQLIYLYFTSPRKDIVAFQDWAMNENEKYLNPIGQHIMYLDLNDKIREITGDSSVPSSGTKRFKGIVKTDLDKAYYIFRALYGNPQDFTFLFTGNFNPTEILLLAQKYLGNLPNMQDSIKCNSTYNSTKSLPTGPLYNEISIQYPNNKVNLLYKAIYIKQTLQPKDWREQVKVMILGYILQEKVKSLRFEHGFAIYLPLASGKLIKDLSRFEISFTADCEQKELEQIKDGFRTIISEIKSGQINKNVFKNYLQKMEFINEVVYGAERMEALNQLYSLYKYGIPLVKPSEKVQYINSLSLDQIVKTANKYLNQDNFYEFVLRSN